MKPELANLMNTYFNHCEVVISAEIAKLREISAGDDDKIQKTLATIAAGAFVSVGANIVAELSTPEGARELLLGLVKALEDEIDLAKQSQKKSDSPWGQVR